MIRVSASDLESLRYWKNDDNGDLPSLLRRLRHEDPPGPAMLAGRAFAKVMESAKPGEMNFADADGWIFEFGRLDCEIALPPVRELKAEKVYQTKHGPVTLVGKCDGMDGTAVHDQKLTERWDAEKYLDSLQWRAYLDLFGAKKFTYDIFVAKYCSDRCCGHHVEVVDYHPMSFYAYPDLGRDVELAVTELAGIVTRYAPDLIKA